MGLIHIMKAFYVKALVFFAMFSVSGRIVLNVSVSEVNDFDLVIFSVYTMLCICFWIPILLQRGGGDWRGRGLRFAEV